jgi:hypothetical protein
MVVRHEADIPTFQFFPGITVFVIAAELEEGYLAFPMISDHGIAGGIVLIPESRANHGSAMESAIGLVYHLPMFEEYRMICEMSALDEFFFRDLVPTRRKEIECAILLFVRTPFFGSQIMNVADHFVTYLVAIMLYYDRRMKLSTPVTSCLFVLPVPDISTSQIEHEGEFHAKSNKE